MRIELKCKCGATFQMEDKDRMYLNQGGNPDAQGRIFLIEKRADDWQERHQICLGMSEGEQQ